MCGRYAASRTDADLVEAFEIDEVVGEPTPPRWNVAPTQEVRAVLDAAPRPDGADPVDPAETVDAPERARTVRQLRTLRWGLVPSWAKDVSIGSRMINARSETLTEKPAFRRAAAQRRLLVPADGYYEWQARGGRKVPSYLTAHDGSLLAFAGLYERWRDPSREDDDPLRWLASFTIITRPASDELGHLHERCPVIVPPWMTDDWLDPQLTDPELVRQVLDAVPPPSLAVREVSTAVNSVKNEGAHLVEPVEPVVHPGET